MAIGFDTGGIISFATTTYEDYDETLICLWLYKNSIVADSEPPKSIKYGWNEIKISLYFQQQ